eukprot:12922404-Prorocentrum_lima.AAC.1
MPGSEHTGSTPMKLPAMPVSEHTDCTPSKVPGSEHTCCTASESGAQRASTRPEAARVLEVNTS